MAHDTHMFCSVHPCIDISLQLKHTLETEAALLLLLCDKPVPNLPEKIDNIQHLQKR